MSTNDEMTASPELEEDSFSKELEAQTGFSSYKAYLTASGLKNRSDYRFFANSQYLSKGSYSNPSHCCVTDVPKENSAKGLTVRLNQTSRLEWDETHNWMSNFGDSPHAHALEILKVLRSPVDKGSIRIVTWYITTDLVSEWVDVIGVGLQVPSSFFTVVLSRIRSLDVDVNLEEPINRFAHPQHLLIGNAVATLLKNDGSDIPTILIVFDSNSKSHTRSKTKTFLELDEDRKLPFAAPNVDRNHRSWKLRDDLSPHYQTLLRANLEQDVSSTLSDQDLIYSSLLPLFKIASMNVQSLHDSVERYLSKLYLENGGSDKGVRDEDPRRSRDGIYNSLDQERYQLRRAIEECDNDHQFFVDYVASNGNEDWLNKRSYRTAAAYSEFTTRVAKRLEAEVRDYMQLVVGVLSIEESRKSIQLSNTQLDEGKKVTILAFIYVPLNLATSIFGMNLQQLNAEGQPVWVFILTAIVATMLTASVWFCIDQTNSIRHWIRLRGTATSMDSINGQGSRSYSIGVRLTMIYCLMHWGHTKWMIRSKIWFYLLTNNEGNGWNTGSGFWPPGAQHYITNYYRLKYRYQWDLEDVTSYLK